MMAFHMKMGVVLLVASLFLTVVGGNSIVLNDGGRVMSDNSYWLKYFLTIFNQPTVGHFAKYKLCRGMKKEFQVALERKVRNVSGSFIKSFIRSMCNDKSRAVLALWAAELFDFDGDGFINIHEQRAALH